MPGWSCVHSERLQQRYVPLQGASLDKDAMWGHVAASPLWVPSKAYISSIILPVGTCLSCPNNSCLAINKAIKLWVGTECNFKITLSQHLWTRRYRRNSKDFQYSNIKYRTRYLPGSKVTQDHTYFKVLWPHIKKKSFKISFVSI